MIAPWIGLIKNISGAPCTGADYAAQVARGLLGFTKDAVLGVGELAYEAMKGVPKLVRLTQTQSGRLHAQLDAQILAENIKLDNITAGSVGQNALDIGKAIVAPAVDPWKNGQYVESVTRAGTEAFSAWFGWLKGSKAARAARTAKATSLAGTSIESTTTAARASKIASPPLGHVDHGIHIKSGRKPVFSGDLNNYRTHGLTRDPMKSPEGRRMVQEFREQGFDQSEAIRATKRLMETGSSLPQSNPFVIGDKLYKVVSEGGTVGPNSEFWMTRDQFSSFKGMKYDEIADRLGLPLASQQGTKYQVMEITAWRSGTTFTSVVAPTSEIGANGVLWSQSGKGIQTLVTDRRKFTLPKLTTIYFP